MVMATTVRKIMTMMMMAVGGRVATAVSDIGDVDDDGVTREPEMESAKVTSGG